MHRARKAVKRIVESSDSEDDVPLKKLYKSPKNNSPLVSKVNTSGHSSSSESDIENYLQPIHKIDLNSSFFKTQTKNEEEFNKIEKDMFAGLTRLSDSESDDGDRYEHDLCQYPKQEAKEIENRPSTSGTRLNFQRLDEYTRQIEEAKKHVEKYNAKKNASAKREDNMDISSLLAAGETKQLTLVDIKPEDLHSSDFESCDSDQEDWEEIKVNDSQEVKEPNSIPKQSLQIVVDMPDSCKRKKGVDLLAAMKRRLNRIRKENQVYVHKVHLLCWIAHGNFVNGIINSSEILGLALSLLPSDKCYPSDRTDLNYLEQIVHWYKKAIQLTEKYLPKKSNLYNSLKSQISKKQAYNQKMFIYIFVAVLRSLGIQCRLVLSFQVEPLRPPASELHSLASDAKTKINDKSPKNETKLEQQKDKRSHTKQKVSKTKVSASSGDKLEENSRRKTVKTVTNKRTIEGSDGEPKLTTDANGTIKGDNVITDANKKEEKNRKPNTVKIDEIEKKHCKDINNKETVIEKPSRKIDNKEEKLKRENNINTKKIPSNDISNVKPIHTRSKCNSEGNSKVKKDKKETNQIKFMKKGKTKTVSQLDGVNDSDDDITQDFLISQLDGAGDEKKKSMSKKPNLKKLSNQKNSCKIKEHPNRLKNVNSEYNSEDDFRPRSPFLKKNTDSPKLLQNRKVNLNKLKTTSTKTDQPNSSAISPKKQLDVKNDIINLVKGRITEQKHIERNRKVKKRKPPSSKSDSDSDFMPEPIKKKYHDVDSDTDYVVPKPKVKQRIRVTRRESDNKLIPSGSDPEKTRKKKDNNVWIEVFLESEEKWISVDVVHGQVHCVNQLFTRATHPISYIVAWNNDNGIKDITKRYCTNFNTVTRRLRVDSKWWDETLKPFLGKYTARDKEEDDDLNRQQLDQPLPKSIAEYKNHPLYALRRHLLKFEEMYPSDIQPIGFVRGEAVYPRNCVYVCHSRDIWLKEAKVVKPGEKPYKIVKARPKYDKLSNKIITDQLLEIFGEWQTMEYEPPTAENGVVPRNAFGNVELFKPCMLPKGTVHLKLPGLNKVCRRMDIDCASAIVGFDFHGGWSHPMYDGFVVCEEFADSVVAAWELEQDEIEKKENEKIEKRVYGNWKKLIKGLLIRERLKAKYDFGEDKTSKENKEGPKFCTKKR